ncbi:FMN-dependent NADH-azoreductase [Pollutimonas bauzanensis]|uniref:FMN dependent NADH:quinone oxidoreductase n=1 Tax=Pollutimonas bauzanensis TaxID=658167 RepID=A0A1M5NE20_9BURK|nr:NAD(P)H-dependent oxidoreductase [Pollutimonas bauzanensis]SHG87705.1 FMN-dependent NADH-azoreductase [Pollutimonas bauzanensis]
MKLLHVDSSINGANSISRKLTKDIVAQWMADHPGTEVQYLDLAADTPSHFSSDAMGFRLPPSTEALTDAQRRENALSEALVSQFLAADVIVVGAPLYNFSIPSQLKSWIDRLAQAGRTFSYTENGPVGLAKGKTVIAALSRGGIYSTSEAGRAMEHQETYLKTIFGFFGITDVRVVRAEGTAMGAESLANALQTADECIKVLATSSFVPESAEAAA